MCTHNNNIYLFLPCKFEYLLIFPAGFGNDFKWDPIPYLFNIMLLIILIQIFFYSFSILSKTSLFTRPSAQS